MTDLADLDQLRGGVTPDVGRTLHDLARAVPAGQAIVEIGSYLGKSISYLAAGASKDVPLFAVDPWESVEPSRWFRRNRWPDPTLQGFGDQLDSVGLRERITAVMGLSVDVATTYDGPPISLLFIDGDHRAGAAENDFHAWRAHLAPGVVVVFDDYGITHNPEVAKDVEQLASLIDGPITTANAGRLAIAKMP